MSAPHLLLHGDRLALAMTTAEHLAEYHRWETDPGTILGYGTQLPQSFETRSAGYESQARSDRQARFEVVRLSDAAPVGMTVLHVDHAVRTAEFVMLLAPEARGQGYAAEAATLTLDWGFHLAALRMVWLKVLEPNAAAIRAYERAGFRPAGRLRQAGWWHGESCDELLMDAVRADFPGPSRVPG
ncbi:GNAT family N-acetyltransferase [Jiangella alkaliphila]|uniref:Protein N-acetyltransferase, RimJ/RimL family n=1 Tax=Jiangella alkaliphila TaxID=419479 RepID=A0A1H2L5P7_9ACTN|nr:GNAT family protein [Jiangella alkaliphila]SDU76303.1 Protein N-acetyltransferase, RimJ/RimL family [Jiangella alkaliphila]